VAWAPFPQCAAPAEDGQALVHGQPGDLRLRRRGLGGVAGQEDEPGGVAAGGGQAERAGGAEQGVGDLGQDASPITGVRVAALGAAMVQVPQHGEGLGDGLVGAAAREVGHEAHATGVVLKLAVVQSPIRLGEAAPRAASSGGACRTGRGHSCSCRPSRPYSRLRARIRDNIGPAAGRRRWSGLWLSGASAPRLNPGYATRAFLPAGAGGRNPGRQTNSWSSQVPERLVAVREISARPGPGGGPRPPDPRPAHVSPRYRPPGWAPPAGAARTRSRR
jgi:hypothetical protein